MRKTVETFMSATIVDQVTKVVISPDTNTGERVEKLF